VPGPRDGAALTRLLAALGVIAASANNSNTSRISNSGGVDVVGGTGGSAAAGAGTGTETDGAMDPRIRAEVTLMRCYLSALAVASGRNQSSTASHVFQRIMKPSYVASMM
jgi:hypothetical protein